MLGAALTISTWALNASSASVNLVSNGTFDTDLAGWTQAVGPGTIPTTWVAGTAHVGQPGTPGTSTFSQVLTIGSTNIAYGFTYQWQVNKPTNTDTFSAKIQYAKVGGGTDTVTLLSQGSNDVTAAQFNSFNFVVNTSALLANLNTSVVNNATLIFTLVETNSPVGTRIQLDNVMVSNVPLPAAAWLFGSALIGLVAVARRKAVV